jgi:glyoxylate reductase
VFTLVPVEDDLAARIREICDFHELETDLSRTALLDAVQDADGILLTPSVRADAEFFDAAPRLRVLSTTSVGYDPFDIPEATKRGVVVCHTPNVLNASVANLTMSIILSLTLRLFEHESYVRSGGWARREPAPGLGTDVNGKTLGVIGFGRIGQEVSRRMQALGMRTLWYDVVDTPHPNALTSEYRAFNDLLAESDVVTLHTNLSEASYHLIGATQLALMKSTAFLVNTARGPLVDQVALRHALESGQIAGAGLDVLENEPPDPNDAIVRLPNVICFPHIGTATEETRRAMRELAVQNLLAVLTGNMPPAPVNPEVLG